MAVKQDAKPQLPAGLSAAEEAAWWDKHRDYWDTPGEGGEAVDEVVEAARLGRTRPITMRLPVAMIDALKREADARALPYQTLIRMWLKERLDRSSAAV